MKFWYQRLLVLWVFVFGLVGPLLAADARFDEASGAVEFMRPGSTGWEKAAAGTTVPKGSLLRTGPLSGAKVVTAEGHVLRLRADSEATLENLGSETEINLKIGALRSHVAKVKGKYTVKTPTAVAAVRGTIFDMIVDAAGRSITRVFEGVIALKDVMGIGDEIRLTKGQTSVIESGKPPKAPEPMPKEILDQGRAPEESDSEEAKGPETGDAQSPVEIAEKSGADVSKTAESDSPDDYGTKGLPGGGPPPGASPVPGSVFTIPDGQTVTFTKGGGWADSSGKAVDIKPGTLLTGEDGKTVRVNAWDGPGLSLTIVRLYDGKILEYFSDNPEGPPAPSLDDATGSSAPSPESPVMTAGGGLRESGPGSPGTDSSGALFKANADPHDAAGAPGSDNQRFGSSMGRFLPGTVLTTPDGVEITVRKDGSLADSKGDAVTLKPGTSLTAQDGSRFRLTNRLKNVEELDSDGDGNIDRAELTYEAPVNAATDAGAVKLTGEPPKLDDITKIKDAAAETENRYGKTLDNGSEGSPGAYPTDGGTVYNRNVDGEDGQGQLAKALSGRLKPGEGGRGGNALGDVYHATPVAVEPPESYVRDQGYQDFRGESRERPRMQKVEMMFGRGISPAVSQDRGPREEGPRPPEEIRSEFRQEAGREIRIEFTKEGFQRGAKEELRQGQYQESKTLIDAFGKRVRVEEYITRPTPESFKFVALNTRDGRVDSGTIEVVANKTLPEDLSVATREMFFKAGDTAPQFTVLKLRRFLTNGTDSHAFMAVDGASHKVKILGARLDPQTGRVEPADTAGFQTVFSHQYEFLNGDTATMDSVFNGTLRPGGDLRGNSLGITQHIVPILIPPLPTGGAAVTIPDWNQTDLTGFGFNYVRTGNITSQESFFAPAGKDFAHFQRQAKYHTYTDGAGGSRFFTIDSDGTLGGTRTDGTADADGTALSDSIEIFDGDTHGAGHPDILGASPFVTATFDERIIDDEGKLFKFSGIFSSTTDQIEGSSKLDLLERLNFETTLSASNFTGPEKKIDLVISPRIPVQTGLIDLDKKAFQ